MSHTLAITSEMTAAVLSVAVEPGAVVSRGSTLLLVESMKMEIPIAAPADGTVTQVRCTTGDVVAEGDTMIVMQPA